MSAAVESLARAFAFDRDAVAAGQWWRLASGLVSHWSAAHLAANAATIAVLATLVARREGVAIVARLLGVTLVVQLAALAWMSEAAQYRGASGIAWALAVFAALR